MHPTLSNATKLEVVVGDHESANPYRLRQFRRAVPDKDGNQSPVKKSALSDSTVELNEIKQSVERLRAQRTHVIVLVIGRLLRMYCSQYSFDLAQVEQLRQSNERLKVQLGQQHKDNTRLRGELTRYQAMEQENIGLLQTIKLLEERSRTLESMCQEKRVEFRKASEELAQVEQERDQLLLTMEGIEQDHAETIKIHVAEQTRLRDRIVVLERKQDNQLDERVTRDREWSEKLKSAENKLAVIQQEHEQELKQCRDEKRGLNSTIGELEDQVQKLLATTVRQTAIIEDCDRALSESKKQHSSATENYQDQCQANSELTARVQQLEAQLASNQASWNEGNIKSEKIILVLESKLSKRRDKLEAFRIAIQEKDKQLQEAQRDQLVRDRNRYHSDEVGKLRQNSIALTCKTLTRCTQVNKELKKREQILQSEISELRLALQDVTDEKNILGDRIFELQGAQSLFEASRNSNDSHHAALIGLLAQSGWRRSKRIDTAGQPHASSCSQSFATKRTNSRRPFTTTSCGVTVRIRALAATTAKATSVARAPSCSAESVLRQNESLKKIIKIVMGALSFTVQPPSLLASSRLTNNSPHSHCIHATTAHTGWGYSRVQPQTRRKPSANSYLVLVGQRRVRLAGRVQLVAHHVL